MILRELPLSFAQQRRWFLALREGIKQAYHIPLGLHLQGRCGSFFTPRKDQTRSAKTPLFLMHETSGEVLPYLQVAKLLPDVPVYGLEAGPLALLGTEITAESVGLDTSKKFARCTLTAGWSFRGILAYEIARQLLALGNARTLSALLTAPSVSAKRTRRTKQVCSSGP
jgi:hypothetical protein